MKRRSIIVLTVLTVVFVAAACQTGGASSPSATSAGIEGTWQWTASTETVPASQAVVPDPENYTITFNADGTFAAKADCNQVAGTYTADGSNLALVLGPSTLAACAEGSLGGLYVEYLDLIATYAISGDQLTATFIDDTGTMTFTKA
jgi:heat shock protein HslJ